MPIAVAARVRESRCATSAPAMTSSIWQGRATKNASRVSRTWKQHPALAKTTYFNHFYVYDIQTDTYGRAPSLPFDDVATITVVVGDTAYMLPGETAGFVWEGEYFGHHPEFVLKGGLGLSGEGT